EGGKRDWYPGIFLPISRHLRHVPYGFWFMGYEFMIYGRWLRSVFGGILTNVHFGLAGDVAKGYF
ncbi:MAG: hypothetical protein ACE5DO_13375, partial [Desulfobacterales bacterium]